MARYTKRNYRRKSYKKKPLYKRKYKFKMSKRKQKPYESHKIAVKDITEINVNAGDISTTFSAKIPWYFEEEVKGERLLDNIANQDVFRSATQNYERYRPIGVKIKFTPSMGATQRDVDYHFLVSDGNTNLKLAPLSTEQAMQHKYYRQLKPGREWKHYINLKKHAKGLGLGWVSTSTPTAPTAVPERLWQGVQARPWGFTQIQWNRSIVTAAEGLPLSFGILKRTYYYEFVDRKAFGQAPS